MVNKFLMIFAGVLLLAFTKASAQEPGSQEDPIVSKSYVDTAIANAIAGITGEPVQPPAAPAGGDGFKPVNLKPGQIALGGEGTEMILRNGQGKAYQTGEDGIVNITTGVELLLGDEVMANNLIIVPRSDGRGVQVFEDSWLLIKGNYTVVNE